MTSPVGSSRRALNIFSNCSLNKKEKYKRRDIVGKFFWSFFSTELLACEGESFSGDRNFRTWKFDILGFIYLSFFIVSDNLDFSIIIDKYRKKRKKTSFLLVFCGVVVTESHDDAQMWLEILRFLKSFGFDVFETFTITTRNVTKKNDDHPTVTNLS